MKRYIFIILIALLGCVFTAQAWFTDPDNFYIEVAHYNGGVDDYLWHATANETNLYVEVYALYEGDIQTRIYYEGNLEKEVDDVTATATVHQGSEDDQTTKNWTAEAEYKPDDYIISEASSYDVAWDYAPVWDSQSTAPAYAQGSAYASDEEGDAGVDGMWESSDKNTLLRSAGGNLGGWLYQDDPSETYSPPEEGLEYNFYVEASDRYNTISDNLFFTYRPYSGETWNVEITHVNNTDVTGGGGAGTVKLPVTIRVDVSGSNKPVEEIALQYTTDSYGSGQTWNYVYKDDSDISQPRYQLVKDLSKDGVSFNFDSSSRIMGKHQITESMVGTGSEVLVRVYVANSNNYSNANRFDNTSESGDNSWEGSEVTSFTPENQRPTLTADSLNREVKTTTP